MDVGCSRRDGRIEVEPTEMGGSDVEPSETADRDRRPADFSPIAAHDRV
jgi:hypothetical protein